MITGGGDSCHSRYADEKSKCLVRALELKGDGLSTQTWSWKVMDSVHKQGLTGPHYITEYQLADLTDRFFFPEIES